MVHIIAKNTALYDNRPSPKTQTTDNSDHAHYYNRNGLISGIGSKILD
jgi:hypothetical protein